MVTSIRSEKMTKSVPNIPIRLDYIVKTYRLVASNGRHIRMATKVILPDGSEIKFLDKLSHREAIEQAKLEMDRRIKEVDN